MSALPHDDAPPADGAVVLTRRTICHREVGRADLALVGVYCTVCYRTVPLAAAVRDERADFRCLDTTACRDARARRATMIDEGDR